MSQTNIDRIVEQLVLADSLLLGRDTMIEPQDLPGRYGRVVQAIDRLLTAIECTAIVGGGWAVWRHGFVGRVTRDIDVVLPSTRIEEFLKVAAVSGFQILTGQPGRWPKIQHRETEIQVDILPEGERPGSPPNFAPTTIPHPSQLGASDYRLRYANLAGLVELKIAAGRLKDKADVVELLRANRDQIDDIRQHLTSVHRQYVAEFDELLKEANRTDP